MWGTTRNTPAGTEQNYEQHQSEYLVSTPNIMAQLDEAQRYKPEGRGIDSRWCHWNFSLT
jgi:hypothetical protein